VYRHKVCTALDSGLADQSTDLLARDIGVQQSPAPVSGFMNVLASEAALYAVVRSINPFSTSNTPWSPSTLPAKLRCGMTTATIPSTK
jgi:hypothetical protein